jgi:hypothetical protein
MSSWLKERGRSLLDNAAYEGVRLLILAVVLPLIYAGWKYITKQPLQWIVLLTFVALGMVALGLLAVAHSRNKKGHGVIKPKEPQPVIVAIDELKSLLHEGERLVGRFQEDSIKPTFPEVEDWRKRTRECARQKVLATENLVRAKDLLRLEKPWHEDELLRIAAKFVDHGCLLADDSVGIAVFKHLWGSVERLKELIAKIEGEELPATATAGLTGELNTQRKSGAARRVANEAIRIARENNIPFTLYALQNAGVGTLDTEDEFQAARELIIQCNLPDPTKDLSLVGGLTWLKLVKFANEKEIALCDKVSVYDCIHAFFTQPVQPKQPIRRTITFDQETKIIDRLKGLKLQPVWITTPAGAHEDDPETYEYANQVKRVLSRAGVTINQSALGLGTLFPSGVGIFVKHHLYNAITVAAIIDAIRLTGVECKTAQRQVWSEHGAEPEINLMIGKNEITPSL